MRKFHTKTLTNKKMNDKTYALRRQVIELIYEAKTLCPELPRLDVRITDNPECNTLGMGRMSQNIIWITEKMVSDRHVVFHEICHAAFGTPHIATCHLMKPLYNGIVDKKKIDAALVTHYKTWLAKQKTVKAA